MKATLFASVSLFLAAMGLSAIAAPAEPDRGAEHAAPVATGGADQKITFEAYRDWRLDFNERRRAELGVQLNASDLTAERKAHLQQTKEYYDWLAGLPAADRDRRFRERFDRIDANHDGEIDPTERAAWREKQRAVYYHDNAVRPQTATAQ